MAARILKWYSVLFKKRFAWSGFITWNVDSYDFGHADSV